KVKRIAVIGKLGNAENTGDHGSSRVYSEYVVTPLEGIKKLVPNIEVVFEDGEDLEKAKEAAKTSDVVLFVVGYDYNDEGEYINNDQDDNKITSIGNFDESEGGDRKGSLGLHEDEIQL